MFESQELMQRLSRHAAVWESNNSTPLIGARIPKEPKSAPKIMPQNFIKAQDSPEEVLSRALDYIDNTYFLGDALPIFFPNFGTSGHAKYFLHTQLSYGDDTVWYSQSFPEVSETLLQEDSSVFSQELAIFKYLAGHGKGRFLLGMPDNCGSLDALAHLFGNEALLCAMVEQPDTVYACMQKMVLRLKETSEQFFAAAQENTYGGTVHGWMNLWYPGKHLQLEADLSVMISPDMFRRFVLPELQQTAKFLDAAVYHLDGVEQLRFLDLILSIPTIKIIQWTHVAGQPSPTQFMEELQKIQRAGRGLVLFPEAWEVPILLDSLSPKGLNLMVRGLHTPEEWQALIDKCG